ncbi:hypothetical protein ACIP93_02345 [Streptomyces sp. NPDC088745]|uniref:hypothetical protein n=1 Tax=Streptomyces sp. NPDC088745 TaxID=3365884 RepID=UPI00382FCAA7
MTTSQQHLVLAAARNNAAWCAAMSRSHGLAGEFGDRAWSAPARTPLYYPDAVTLAPHVVPETLVSRIDTAAPGASVKDSFADLDLAGSGFGVLFEAQWIHRPAGAAVPAPESSWQVADSPEELLAWALAWDGGAGNADLFRAELLDDPDTFVVAVRDAGGGVAAGAVVSRSDRVAGVSNVFGSPAAAWPAVLHAVGSLLPALPVVGYEQGEDLAAALRHGFEPIGPLRVWLHGL